MARPKLPDTERTEPRYARFKRRELQQIEAAAKIEEVAIAAYIHKATMAYTRDNFDFDAEGGE